MTAVAGALLPYRGALIGTAVFSAAMNLLMLTGPLFMLQVYDRVLVSRSVPTLLALTLIAAFMFLVMGLLDLMRGRVLARIGAGFQARLDGPVFDAIMRQAEDPQLRSQPSAGLRDLSAVRYVLGSPATGALFDLPWAPVCGAVIFLLHPSLGWFALATGAIILLLACANQRRGAAPLDRAARDQMAADESAEVTRRGIETVQALGMLPDMAQRWTAARQAALRSAVAGADVAASYSSATQSFRLLAQSGIIALGAWLVLQGQMSAGAMIAGSILLGRALSPIEQVVRFWPHIQRAFAGWQNLKRLLSGTAAPVKPMPLPRPRARLDVVDLAVSPPGEQVPTLQGVTFSACAGDAIAVIGPAAAGKSSLARALVGLWPPARGEVRLGGAGIGQYDRQTRGRLFGYLSQDVSLFPGTIAQNIARFVPDPDAQAVTAAAKAAAAHEMILSLPRGYDTQVGDCGCRLSGGQRQRVALARAFFGEPVMLVLDEPNASLDDPGVQALNRAIASARADGRIALVLSHRPSALAACNLVLFLDGGRMRAFGPRDEVLGRILRPDPRIDVAKPAAEAAR